MYVQREEVYAYHFGLKTNIYNSLFAYNNKYLFQNKKNT